MDAALLWNSGTEQYKHCIVQHHTICTGFLALIPTFANYTDSKIARDKQNTRTTHPFFFGRKLKQ